MESARTSRPDAQGANPFKLSAASMAYASRLDSAEACVTRQNYAQAAQVLHRAPTLLQGTGDGRVLELMALCATHAKVAGSADPAALWTRALYAYQEAHAVSGMERCHRALGLLAFRGGDLGLAAKELRYAQRLVERQHRPDACVYGLCQQAEVGMALGHQAEQALQWAHQAVEQSHHEGIDKRAMVHARLIRAQTFCILGNVAEAAKDMLWAERLGSLVTTHTESALRLALTRAQSLLLLGHPRRAATCLQEVAEAAARCQKDDLSAQYQLGLCQALVNDQPHAAHQAGLVAQAQFVARRQHYSRAACDIALTRTALRLGRHDLPQRLAALGGHRLDKWPLMAFALRQAAAEVNAPHHTALGAVQTPWVHAVGQINMSERKTAAGPKGPGKPQSWMTRLHDVWGRVTGEESSGETRQSVS